MYSKEMYELGNKRSVIREIFEYGKKRAQEVGKDNVFDFSLGNPNVPAPECIKDSILQLLSEMDAAELHGYTSAQGDYDVRKTLADDINKRFGVNFSADDLYMTVGAAASLTISFKALCNEGDEFIAIAPYFPEYKVFCEGVGGELKVVKPDLKNFEIDFGDLEKKLSEKTKGIVINSPNNPSGKVYGEDTIVKLCNLLKEKQIEYGHPIYILADEPYREIVYGEKTVPYLPCYYDNTLVCYSYSKSLSLPGERIGYIAVNPKAEDAKDIYLAVCGAGRTLGYVCASSMYQRVVAKCVGQTSDIEYYRKNRDILYNALTSYGYEAVSPDGAFYLFVKALEKDANAFCERAKKYDLLLVPGDGFGCPGYVRISYCVKTEQIERSLEKFKLLAEEYAK